MDASKALNEQRKRAHVELSLIQALTDLENFTPSRERSLVKTKIEEAIMWLQKCRDGENQ